MAEENATAAGGEPNAGTSTAQDGAFLFENADANTYGETNAAFLKENNLSNMSDLIALATKGKGALSVPADGDDAGLLALRRACGYPETVEGYGFNSQTEEEKSIADFIFNCGLDKWAAQKVYSQVLEDIKSTAEREKQEYEAAVAKIKSGWGESAKANESLLQRGVATLKLSETQLQELSGVIGVEAALELLQTIGKVKTDSSGITGSNGGAAGVEDLGSFILSRRDM